MANLPVMTDRQTDRQTLLRTITPRGFSPNSTLDQHYEQTAKRQKQFSLSKLEHFETLTDLPCCGIFFAWNYAIFSMPGFLLHTKQGCKPFPIKTHKFEDSKQQTIRRQNVTVFTRA